MTVWVVLSGEQCEGGYVVGIYHKREDALKKVMSIEGHFDDKQFKPADGLDDYWINGCDFIRIDEHEVL